VQPGDNLWIIARRNNVSVSEITQWNNMDKSAQLKIGQAIKIYSNTQQKTVTNNKNKYLPLSVKDKKEEQTNTYTCAKRRFFIYYLKEDRGPFEKNIRN
jgi:LysM repeat protein